MMTRTSRRVRGALNRSMRWGRANRALRVLDRDRGDTSKCRGASGRGTGTNSWGRSSTGNA